MLLAGQKVRFKKLSKDSYYLYKSYLDKFPTLECPCHFKDETLTVVREFFNNSTILTYKDRMTICYSSDLQTAE